jgi:hypothetical protein
VVILRTQLTKVTPILLDPSMTTLERFGVPGRETILIDPEGRLVEGDEKTLAKKLAEKKYLRMKPTVTISEVENTTVPFVPAPCYSNRASRYRKPH